MNLVTAALSEEFTRVSLSASLQKVDDERLMQRFLHGDDEALETLVLRYQNPLYAFALRLLGDKAAAEDAFQETFLRVYRKRRSFVTGKKFRPWLYQICLNLCRDTLRAATRKREVSLTDVTLSHSSPDPADCASTLMEVARLRRALKLLPTKQREVIVLSHYQGFSYPEISQILGVPVGTVKSRNHHALHRLSKTLTTL